MKQSDRIKEKFNTRRVFLLPYFSVIIVLLITVGATYLFYNNATKSDEIRFENKTTQINSRLENQLYKQVAALRSTEYVVKSDQNIIEENSIIKSNDVGFLKYTEQNNSRPSQILTSNINAFEFQDLAQNTFRLETVDKEKMIKSINNDEVVISEVEVKNASGRSSNGYLLLLPIFSNNSGFGNRNNSFLGFAFYSFDKNAFIENIFRTNSIDEVGLQLSFGDIKIIDQELPQSDLVTKKEIDTFGLIWNVEYKPLSAFFDESNVHLTVLIPLGGIFLGILVFGFLRAEAVSKVALAKIAEELNDAKSKNEALLKSEQAARKQAEVSNRLKDDFISMVSHEIRTPLNSISGWASILNGNNITEEIKRRALQTIKKNIKNQSDIIDELLLFSNLNSEEQLSKNDMTKISGIVESAFKDVIPDARRKKIHLIKENSLNGEQIVCDEKKMHKAIRNMLENAIKFTPIGGEVKLIAEKDTDKIKLKIKDSGKGIKKELLPHIFDEFRQADSSTTRNFGGLGLGLTISNQIIELHGGKISVKSEGEDKGTEFEITLPKTTYYSVN